MSLKKTPLHSEFIKLGCKMSPFAGWDMPIQFTSLINEHISVRNNAGIFDISHMGIFAIEGLNAKDKLQKLVPTDLDQISDGEACYTVLLNDSGGVIDDVIIYDLGIESNIEKMLIVINASCTSKDMKWLNSKLYSKEINIFDLKNNNLFLALQGPNAINTLEKVSGLKLSNMQKFSHSYFKSEILESPIFISRTGYTGEDGIEFLSSPRDGQLLWEELIKAGVTPCGLGARDTLRLESGMHLYGNELDEKTTPFEASLGWLVNLEMNKDFYGRAILEKQAKFGIERKLVGIQIEGKAIGRKGYPIKKNNIQIGQITSGTWSPSLKKPVAMGYVKKEFSTIGATIDIEIRGKLHSGTIVKRQFYKH